MVCYVYLINIELGDVYICLLHMQYNIYLCVYVLYYNKMYIFICVCREKERGQTLSSTLNIFIRKKQLVSGYTYFEKCGSQNLNRNYFCKVTKI
jgi:hypothetical protein